MIPAFATDLSAHGDAPCLLRTGAAPVSYAGLAARADAFARRLGTGRKLVAIEAAASVEMVAAWLGALRGGHAVALLPAGEPAAMDRFRRQFLPDAVFARANGRWRLTLDGRGAGPIHSDLSLLLMTSGSTGHGKGVRLSGAAVDANAAAIADYLGLAPQDRAALVLPLHYSYGLSVLNSHLAAGASVWLAEGSILSEGFLPALAASGATSLSTVPHGFELLERTGFAAADLPALKTLTVAGGALAPATQRRFAARMAAQGGRFFAMYGQTEAVARIAYLPPDCAESHAGMIGRAIPGGALSLRDDAGQILTADGAEGELVYHGPNVMMGYAETRADLARGAEVAALATGDIARREGDFFRIIGRKRRMSKIAGLRVGHDAVEAALTGQGLAAAVWGDDTCLWVAVEGPADADALTLRVAALAGLTPAHVRLRILPRLPRLPSGKIDYPALGRDAADAGPRGVADAFATAFHPRPVGPRDSFATLGGDSLRHVELALALERALGHLPENWERRPLAELAALTPQHAMPRVTVGSDLAMRALAILMVVVTHETLWPVYGGAAVMVVLIGHQLARFQRDAMAMGQIGRLFRPLGRVLVPYYLILAGFALAWGQVPWGSLVLISNFGIGDPAMHDRLPFLYWFVEAYAQMLVLLAGLMLVPPLRRMAGQAPLAFGACLLAGAMALRFIAPPIMGLGGRQIFTVPWVLYLLALGWMAAVAQGRQRWLVVAAASVVLPLVAYHGGNWHGAWIKYGTVWGVLMVLMAVPRLTLPRWLAEPVLVIASSSYLIYLTHRLVPEVALAGLAPALTGWLSATFAIAGGIGLGIALTALGRGLTRRVEAQAAGLRDRLARAFSRAAT